MNRLIKLMSVYQAHHTKKITKFTHFIGIPSIIFALQIFFAGILIANISLAWIILFALLIFYLFLDLHLTLVSAVFLLPITIVALHISQSESNRVFITVFLIIGLSAQYLGHYFEKNSPALKQNISQIFIAPIFLVAEFVFALGLKRQLQLKILQEIKLQQLNDTETNNAKKYNF